MAKISGLTLLGAAPADDDEFVILDVSDTTQGAGGSTKGLVATRVARTGAANSFTGLQTITSAGTSLTALDLNTPANPTVPTQRWLNNGVERARLETYANLNSFRLLAWDNGTGRGSRVTCDRNNNASTPAAGHVLLEDRGGQFYYVWPDDTGVLRIGTTEPVSAQDTSGTVVGTQTSWHELKEAIAEWDGANALESILSLTLYSYQMIEDGQKTTDGEKPTYYGLVITEEDRANNAWFGLGYGENQTPVLNDRNLFGYLIAAVKEQAAQIEALTARVTALEGA